MQQTSPVKEPKILFKGTTLTVQSSLTQRMKVALTVRTYSVVQSEAILKNSPFFSLLYGFFGDGSCILGTVDLIRVMELCWGLRLLKADFSPSLQPTYLPPPPNVT